MGSFISIKVQEKEPTIVKHGIPQTGWIDRVTRPLGTASINHLHLTGNLNNPNQTNVPFLNEIALRKKFSRMKFFLKNSFKLRLASRQWYSTTNKMYHEIVCVYYIRRCRKSTRTHTKTIHNKVMVTYKPRKSKTLNTISSNALNVRKR